ncbi:hypothetical protein Q5705_02240 [Kosakonia sp. H02]|nr:hypothetical protein Q5705_02240 [Kosakonia sp. H02]
MYSNIIILDKMHADRFLALTLDNALTGVRDEMLEQAKNIQAGAARLAFYVSCFTTNYQDVCEKQKAEDVRFMRAIVKLIGKSNVIEQMVRIYVDLLLKNLTPERIQRINRELFKHGATFASGSVTNQTLGGAIVAAVCYSFSLSVSIERALLRYSTRAVIMTGLYSYIQDAADAAGRLKQQNGIYYYTLYAETLEMLYFLIEPIISRNSTLNRLPSSDAEITEAIMRIIR